jgi:hypothetical protein
MRQPADPLRVQPMPLVRGGSEGEGGSHVDISSAALQLLLLVTLWIRGKEVEGGVHGVILSSSRDFQIQPY